MPVNLEALNQFDDGATVDEAALRAAGLANGGKRIKILGDGELKKKLTVKVHSFSASAREKIEKLGGVCEMPAPTAGQVAAAGRQRLKTRHLRLARKQRLPTQWLARQQRPTRQGLARQRRPTRQRLARQPRLTRQGRPTSQRRPAMHRRRKPARAVIPG